MACSPRSAPRFLTWQTSPSCRARWPGRSPAGGRGSGVLWAWPGPACCRAVRAWTNGCFPERTAGCPFAPLPRSSRASLAARGAGVGTGRRSSCAQVRRRGHASPATSRSFVSQAGRPGGAHRGSVFELLTSAEGERDIAAFRRNRKETGGEARPPADGGARA